MLPTVSPDTTSVRMGPFSFTAMPWQFDNIFKKRYILMYCAILLLSSARTFYIYIYMYSSNNFMIYLLSLIWLLGILKKLRNWKCSHWKGCNSNRKYVLFFIDSSFYQLLCSKCSVNWHMDQFTHHFNTIANTQSIMMIPEEIMTSVICHFMHHTHLFYPHWSDSKGEKNVGLQKTFWLVQMRVQRLEVKRR